MKSWKDHIDGLKNEINTSLEEFLTEKVNQSRDGLVREISSMIREYSLRGGKRVRPLLVLLGHDLFKPHNRAVVRASLSIEISQSYFIIQDDIMDQSPFRRGFPSFHIEVQNRYFGGDPSKKRISENLGIIASDLADSYSHEAIISSGLPPEIALKGEKELCNIFEVTGHGQLIDVFSAENDSFSEPDLIKLHLWKTARYTIEGPLMLGAAISGTSEKLNDLSHFGNLLGVAFQLHDDILGVFGDEKKTGKSIKSDINEGKKTMLVLKAIEFGSDEQADFIRRSIRSGSVTDAEFERVKKIMIDTGSLDYSRKLADRFVERAKKYLEKVHGNEEIKSVIGEFSDYLISRDS